MSRNICRKCSSWTSYFKKYLKISIELIKLWAIIFVISFAAINLKILNIQLGVNVQVILQKLGEKLWKNIKFSHFCMLLSINRLRNEKEKYLEFIFFFMLKYKKLIFFGNSKKKFFLYFSGIKNLWNLITFLFRNL